MHYIVIDCESTGLASPIAACEIAWIVVDESLAVLDEQVFLTDPQRPIDPGAYAIHGISNESVAGLASNAEICAKIPKPLVWCGHNSSYDQRVLGEHLEWSADLCTLALARRWVKGTTNHKLATLQQELKLSEQKSHSALGDCRTTLELLHVIVKLSDRTLPELVELESQPKMIQKMPFGMHKGKLFADIPKSYRQWMMTQTEWPKDIAYTLEKLKLI
jgi:DNA polymerase III epsilon subunit-like protein